MLFPVGYTLLLMRIGPKMNEVARNIETGV